MRYLVVRDELIENIIEADDPIRLKGYEIIQSDDHASIGDRYVDGAVIRDTEVPDISRELTEEELKEQEIAAEERRLLREWAVASLDSATIEEEK